MELKLSSSSAPKVHSFLRQFALDVDEERLEHALPRVRQMIVKQKAKRGLAFKVLLQELDRQIDWRLAAELEDNFLNN
jgi:hypothetical protein